MILTVTPNTALDRVYFLPSLQRNRRNQATDWVESMGGKGCNVSLILSALGEESVATGLAAGDPGRRMEVMLRQGGVTPDFVWTDGETRINTVLVETETRSHTTLCAAGLKPDRHTLPGLLAWIERWAEPADVTVFASTLPEVWGPEIYPQLLRAASRWNKPIVVDASGKSLQAALEVGVTAIKPNRHELESVAGPLNDHSSIIRAAKRLQEEGATWVLVSLGEDGALLTSPRGTWTAPALEIPVVNPSGAGDGMTACLALGLARGWDEVETLRWAVAVSAAVVTTRGTAEVYREEIDRLFPRVRIEKGH